MAHWIEQPLFNGLSTHQFTYNIPQSLDLLPALAARMPWWLTYTHQISGRTVQASLE
jgi:hypothetical protein